MSVKDALEMAKKNKVEIVDLKFVDFPGLWQHFSIPAAELSAELFEEGLGFDACVAQAPGRFTIRRGASFLQGPCPPHTGAVAAGAVVTPALDLGLCRIVENPSAICIRRSSRH